MKKITSLVLLAMSGAFLLASCGEQPAPSSQPTGSSTDSASTPAAQQITVKFNTDGGSAIADVKVDKGGKVAKPADPTKEGYTFGKWYEDSIKVTEFDFDTPLSSDITLYASWIAAAPASSDSSEPEPDPSTLYFRDDYFWNAMGAVTLVKFDEGEWGAVTHVAWVPVESTSIGYNYWSVQIPDGAVTVTFLRSYQSDTTYSGPHTPTLTLSERGTNNMYDIYKESKTYPGEGAIVQGQWAVYDGQTPAPTPTPSSDTGTSSATPSGETVAISIAKTGMPSWWTGTDPVFFVWAWGGSLGKGQAYPAASGSEAFTTDIPTDATGIQLLRCKTGATEVIWDGASKTVWNKTNAIDFSASTTSYTVTNWEA